MNTQLRIMNLFSQERTRQEQLKKAGRFAHTLADPEMTHQDRFACLGEEFGEVAGAVVQVTGLSNDRQDGRDNLQKELVQLGACVVAWLEALGDPPPVKAWTEEDRQRALRQPEDLDE